MTIPMSKEVRHEVIRRSMLEADPHRTYTIPYGYTKEEMAEVTRSMVSPGHAERAYRAATMQAPDYGIQLTPTEDATESMAEQHPSLRVEAVTSTPHARRVGVFLLAVSAVSMLVAIWGIVVGCGWVK